MSQNTDLIICGAGITGIATAYYLTKYHRMTNVVVVDPHAPLSQTTAKSGENYRNWWPFPPLATFTNRSIDLNGNARRRNRQGEPGAAPKRAPKAPAQPTFIEFAGGIFRGTRLGYMANLHIFHLCSQ